MTAPLVTVIDYGSGNLRSAHKAALFAAREREINAKIVITDKPDDVARASHIILPGQGAFGDCMRGLSAIDGMIDALNDVVLHKGTPFLGICVGMQLMADKGLEHGEHKGLGWISGSVRPIKAPPNLKIPHMGWNDITAQQNKKDLPVRLRSGDHFYFVHSFMFECTDKADIYATVDYGETIPAIIGRDNMIGAQCHIEKSQMAGLTLIGDFLGWRP